MALYAHARIEVPNDPEDPSAGVTRYEQGDEVPEAVAEGLECVSDEPYNPAADKLPPPATVEIDGVRYVQASDGAESTDVRS